MATPVITSFTLDKASYKPGETVTATVKYSDPDARTVNISGTAVDSQGNSSPFAGSFAIVDPVTVAISDDGKRTWTKKSDDGATAVFNATA
jgi:hypothetical protein